MRKISPFKALLSLTLLTVFPFAVKAVYPGQDYLLKAAAHIDKMVEYNLKKQGLEPNALAPDHVFVKRAYLGIAGRIPTYDESVEYLNSNDEYKKLKLIWKLMDSPGYDSTQFNYWADLLRLSDTMPGGGKSRDGGTPYNEWVREQIRKNTPYDQFVSQLITSSGDLWNSGDEASGFYRRDYGMGLDHFAITMQVFSGIQMQCAQCHNHPFEKWTQKEFYEMAAFLKLPKKQNNNPDSNINPKGLKKGLNRQLNSDEMQYYRKNMLRNLRSITGEYIAKEGEGLIKLPANYAYANAKKNEELRARTAFGEEIVFSSNKMKEGPRVVFADWLTSAEHPYFTRIIANRLWKKTMGIGLFEPVDDLRLDTQASYPLLLAFLEKQMIHFEYDIKVYLAMLYCTDLFQRESTAHEYSETEVYHFPGPVIVRMSAEQIWDSLMTLKVDNIDQHVKPPVLGRYQEYQTLVGMDTKEVVDFVTQIAKGKKPGDRRGNGMMISLFTGEISDQAGADSMNRMTAMKKKRQNEKAVPAAYTKVLKNKVAMKIIYEGAELMWKYSQEHEYEKLYAVRDSLRVKASQYQLSEAEMDIVLRHIQRTSWAKKSKYVRASELGSPAPVGHLLRIFGASDRIYLGNASRLPNAPQTLELMNGFIYKQIIDDEKSVLNKTVASAASLDEKIEILFQSIYCRPPTSEEQGEMKSLIQNSSDEAIGGAMWTLLNSLEFLFIL